MSLKDSVIIVRVSISQFYNEQTDTRVSKQVKEAFELDEQNINTKLVRSLFHKSTFGGVRKAISEIRRFVYDETLPWEDGGYRALPNSKYFSFFNGLRQRIDKMHDEVRSVANDHDLHVNIAQKATEKVFRAELLPTADTLLKLFRVNMSVSGVPHPQDFRVMEEDKATAEIRERIEASYKDRLRGLSRTHLLHLWGGISDLSYKMKDPKRKLFRSVVEGLSDSAELGAEIEATCPEIGSYCSQIQKLLNVSMEELRHNLQLRHETATALSTLADEIGAQYGFGKRAGRTETSSEQATVRPDGEGEGAPHNEPPVLRDPSPQHGASGG